MPFIAMVKWLIALLLILFGLLQYRLWVGEGSLADLHALRGEIVAQEAELVRLRQRNAALEAEVESLRSGYEAVEERARSELGMIKRGEVFIQVIEDEDEDDGGEGAP